MRLPLIALLLVALVGCGSDDESAESAPEGRDKPANSAPADPEPSSDCEEPTPALLRAIEEGNESVAFKLGNAAAYLSPDYKQVYFVAAEMSGPGLEDGDVGVWATTNLETGPILAVDGFARQFSVWPDSDQGQMDIGAADPGVGKAKDCLN